MSDVFTQNLQEKEVSYGGPFVVELLFDHPIPHPTPRRIQRVFHHHFGDVELFGHSNTQTGIAIKEQVVSFEEGKIPAQWFIFQGERHKIDRMDPFITSQFWDCQKTYPRLLARCRYHYIATDFLAGNMDPSRRANFIANGVEALMELFPDCYAFYFHTPKKLLPAQDIRRHKLTGPDRFISFGVNVRFFSIQNSQDYIVDTLGLHCLRLPDLQYHFHGFDPNAIVNHAYSFASYLVSLPRRMQSGEVLDGVDSQTGQFSRDIQWKVQHEESLIQPPRAVLDVYMNEWASGNRSPK